MRLLLPGLAAALAFAAVVPQSEWVFDDHVLIERNTELRRSDIWRSAFGRDYYATSEAPGVSGYYRPLAVLCNAFDVHVGRGLPRNAHMTNIVLHVLATLALAPALAALGVPGAAAWITALVFAVHPAHAESVAFVSGRVDVLATLFVLLALAATAAPQRLAWLGVGLLSLLAFLSKESAVVLPVLVLLFFWQRRTLVRVFGPVMGAGLVALGLRARALPRLLPSTAQGGPVVGGVLLPLQTLAFALAALFAPVARLAIEPEPARLDVLQCGLGIAVAVAAWIAAWMLSPGVRGTLLRIGIAAVVTLLPVLNLLPQETRLSERFLYLPSAFLLVPLGVLAQRGWERRGPWRAAAVTVLALVVLGLGGISSWRARLWRNDITVWQQAVREEPARAAFWDRLGLAHMERRAYAPAEAALRRSLELDARGFNAWYNLGVLLEAKRDYREAAAAFRRALELQPVSVGAHVRLGRLLVAGRDLEAAYAEFTAALALKPDHFDALRMAGKVAIQIELFDEAERHLEAARRLEPQNVEIQQTLQKLAARRQQQP